jgi:hypothetical protein
MEPLKELSKDVFTINKPSSTNVKLYWECHTDEGPASVELMVNPAELVPPAPENLQAVPTQSNVYLI